MSPGHSSIERTPEEERRLDSIFKALSHSVRRGLLARLSNGSAMITELAEPYDMSIPAVSKHLGVLQEAGLVTIAAEGRVRRCSLNADALQGVEEWLEYYRAFWSSALDSLADFVENEKSKSNP